LAPESGGGWGGGLLRGDKPMLFDHVDGSATGKGASTPRGLGGAGRVDGTATPTSGRGDEGLGRGDSAGGFKKGEVGRGCKPKTPPKWCKVLDCQEGVLS